MMVLLVKQVHLQKDVGSSLRSQPSREQQKNFLLTGSGRKGDQTG